MLEDFIRIKANLDTQIASVDAEQATIEAEMGASRSAHDMHQTCIAELQGEIAHLQAEIATLEGFLQAQQLDLLLAQATSLEEEKVQGVQATEERIRLAHAEIAVREERIASNRTAQVDIQAELDAHEKRMAELSHKARSLQQSRRRFDQEHLAAALPIVLRPIHQAQARIVSLEAQVEQAKRERLVAQEEAARQLAEWPVEGARALAEHGHFEPDANTQFLSLYLSLMEFCEVHHRHLTGVAAETLARSDLPFLRYLLEYGSREAYQAMVERRYEIALASKVDSRLIERSQFQNRDYEYFLKWVNQLSNDIAQSHASNQETQARQLLERAQAALVAQAEEARLQAEAATIVPEPEPVVPQTVGKGRLKRRNKQEERVV